MRFQMKLNGYFINYGRHFQIELQNLILKFPRQFQLRYLNRNGNLGKWFISSSKGIIKIKNSIKTNLNNFIEEFSSSPFSYPTKAVAYQFYINNKTLSVYFAYYNGNQIGYIIRYFFKGIIKIKI